MTLSCCPVPRYGSHPFYLQTDPSGQAGATGVFLRNSNGMDVTYTTDSLKFQARRPVSPSTF